MDSNRFELALYVINLKIAKEIKENTEKDYNKFREKIIKLMDEKDMVYKQNEEVINKVLSVYIEEVR